MATVSELQAPFLGFWAHSVLVANALGIEVEELARESDRFPDLKAARAVEGRSRLWDLEQAWKAWRGEKPVVESFAINGRKSYWIRALGEVAEAYRYGGTDLVLVAIDWPERASMRRADIVECFYSVGAHAVADSNGKVWKPR